jgi:lysophospholipase L1-like esterase
LLWRKLQEASITNIDFVGTLPGQGCGFTYDGENEGHGGYLATNIASQGQLVGWLTQTTPDIVMMHLGTNDVWSNKSPQEILGAFQTLVEEMRQSNKNMRILVRNCFT